MPSDFDCDVLIIGAGPCGVTLALLLAQADLRVIVVEKAPEIYPLPRAAHIDHEIVRVFQSLGLAETVLADSHVAARYDFLTASGEILLRFETNAAPSPSGWPASNMIHQPSLEACLREALAQAPHAELRRACTVDQISQSADHITASIISDRGREQVTARYAIGCDGARSFLREVMGAGMDDLQFDEPWLVIDTLVIDPTRLPQANLQICDPARPTTCIQMGKGRHRWEFMMLPGETADQVMADDFIADLLKPWQVDGAVQLERKAVYRFHALVAKHWRQGRYLLAGDAAHQMPPFAGQGLCSGIRDGANLAWKLAAIIHDGADDRLLDSYQSEREPHVRAIIDLALMMGRTVCITDPMAAEARNQAMLAARAASGGEGAPGGLNFPPLSAGCLHAASPGAGELFPQPWANSQDAPGRLDDVLGAGAWLIQRAGTPLPKGASHLSVMSLDDPRIEPFAADLTGWLDRRDHAQAVLVRPDRYVFGTGDAGILAQAWSEALRPTAPPAYAP
jgi:3-(3-hydroxy-phenyl)propionate hydroxylase